MIWIATVIAFLVGLILGVTLRRTIALKVGAIEVQAGSLHEATVLLAKIHTMGTEAVQQQVLAKQAVHRDRSAN